MANRQVKDSVFRKLFNNRKELAKLYQAIHPEDEILPDDIKVTTLKSVFLDNLKNDLSFLWKGKSVVLIEHQSTWNENMPIRLLPYIEHVYRKIIKERDAKRALYLPKLVKIPTPKFYVLYNGPKLATPRNELRLSDAFESDDGDLELVCHIIDISYDSNNDFLQSCEPLRGYSYLVYLIHEHRAAGMGDDEAIRQAVLQCMNRGILKSFLKKYAKEVINMFTLQWNEEEAMKYRTEYAEELGLQKGIQKGIQKGVEQGKGEMILNMLKDHMHLDVIQRISGWTADQIRTLAQKNGLAIE